MKRVILCLALFAVWPALAQTPPNPAPAPSAADIAKSIEQIEVPMMAEQVARSFQARGDLVNETLAWARAVKLRPHIGRYKVELAAVYAQQDLKTQAYNALLELQQQGYAFDLKGDHRFDKVSDTEVWGYILQALDANRAPFGEGKVVHTIPKERELIESLAWDESRKQLLVGSAREGKVFRVASDGSLSVLASANRENGMWAVFDVAVDAKRGVLWVASTAVPHYAGYDAEKDLGRAGVFKFDLKTGKFLKSFLSPSIMGQSFFMSSLALGKDGEVYAADGVNNAVYQVRDDQLRRLFHAPKLTSIRGIAVSDDGRTLFLGDHGRGLIGYDLAAGKPFDILVPTNLALGGIEAIAWLDGQIVVVQSDMVPRRVMRLKLSDDRRSIAAVQPLVANQAEVSLPTQGTLAGGTFYFIANSQKNNYDRFGLVKDKGKLEGTRIFSVDATYSPPEKPKQEPWAPPLKPKD